jgi:hypothetical protein
MLSLTLIASKTETNKTGDWNTSTTWTNGIPSSTNCYDTIVVNQNHTVRITQDIDLSNCTPVYVIVDGTIKLTKRGGFFGTFYALYLPDSSAISVSSTGTVKGRYGFFNSNKIYAGDDVIYVAYDGDADGPDYLAQDNVSLPIELLEFTSTIYHNNIKINWITASEINNEYFILEKLILPDNWMILDTIKGHGNSNEIINYTYIDNNPLLDNYYRLQQVDCDGTTVVFSTIYQKFIQPKEIQIYPNPTNGNTIQINNLSDNDIYIYNSIGILIYSNFNINSNITIDLSMYDNGIYYIRIETYNDFIVKKIILIK